MDYVNLGSTGTKVSRICLGAMTYGSKQWRQWVLEEEESLPFFRRALEAGVNFFDTADMYSVGRSEEITGKALKEFGPGRDKLVIATKVFNKMSDDPNDRGLSRKHILHSIDASLRRLGTDYVDLYQLHGDDRKTPIDEVLEALDVIVRSGKARYVGVSNWVAYRLARAIGRSETRGLVRFDFVQPRYNLLFRQIERELLPLCREEGIAVIPYNPIAGGLLSGKHAGASSAPEQGTRFTIGAAGALYQDRYWHDREFATVEELKSLAADAGLPLVTLAVAWVAAHPAITSPIIGASRPDQLADSVKAVDITLDPDLKAKLDDVTKEYCKGDAPR